MKSLSGKTSFKSSISMMIFSIFLYLYSYWTINSEKRKYNLFVTRLLKLISQFLAVGTQAFLYVDPVQIIFISSIHFFGMTCSQSFLLENLRMVPSVCLFRRYLSYIHPFSHYVNTIILKHPTHSCLKIFVFGWQRYPCLPCWHF